MYPKIKFIAKNCFDLCNFYSKEIFWNFCLRKYLFLFFFAEFELLMFHNNLVKSLEKLNKRNLLKICLQVTYPTHFCIICIHFKLLWEKVKIFDFFKNHWLEWKSFCIGSYDKWFCFKSWQKLANLLLLCNAPSKNDSLKDVKSTVSRNPNS